MPLAKDHVLPEAFYAREPTVVAKELLGKYLVRRTRDGIVRGQIVEVEAYLAAGDSACHTYRGQTPRNRTMFGRPGRLYVYSIHSRFCLNTVTEVKGVGSAVLIRAVEPISGQELMARRRKQASDVDLARGPARLCEAFGVNRDLDGWDLTTGKRIYICDDGERPVPPIQVGRSPRIGVTSAHELELRFFVDRSRYVSGPRKWHTRS